MRSQKYSPISLYNESISYKLHVSLCWRLFPQNAISMLNMKETKPRNAQLSTYVQKWTSKCSRWQVILPSITSRNNRSRLKWHIVTSLQGQTFKAHKTSYLLNSATTKDIKRSNGTTNTRLDQQNKIWELAFRQTICRLTSFYVHRL